METSNKAEELAQVLSEFLSEGDIELILKNGVLKEDLLSKVKVEIGRFKEFARMFRNGNGHHGGQHTPLYPDEPFLENDNGKRIWLHEIENEYNITDEMIGRRESKATADRLGLNEQRLIRFADKRGLDRWRPNR